MQKIRAKLPLEKWFITRTFGNIMEGDKTGKPHAGVDLRANYVPVFAPIDGETKTFTETLGGRWVKLINGDIQFRFAHLSEYKKIGQVKAGDVIAISGNTGSNTTAPHLHFEMWVKGNRVDPQRFMIYNILLKNQDKVPPEVFANIEHWFAAFDFQIMFDDIKQAYIDYWAILDCAAAGSFADTKDTHKTPGVYDIGYNPKNLSEGLSPRTPEDIIVHEILHCLYEDAGLLDIHDYKWGVEDNETVIKFLIIKQKNMDYVILGGKEQFLIFEPWRLAFNIGDEVEAAALLAIPGFPQTPRPVENLDGYTQIAFIRKDRLRDLFGL